jgi:ABC-type Zn uptake system ZnuABC Zn-binding protein ZnuA
LLLRGVVVAVFLVGSGLPLTAQQNRIRVAVTIEALKPLVAAVLGDVGDVYSIVPEEAEPHGFTLTPNVIRSALNSDLVVTTGHMEWEGDLVVQVASEKGVSPDSISLNLLSLAGIQLLKFDGESNLHGFWLLPDNAVIIARGLRDKLSALEPSYSEVFSSNCRDFENRVSNLKLFLRSLSERYGSSNARVVIGFYAEQYVAEAMGLKADAVLVGEEEAISPGVLSKVYNGLKSGDYTCIVVSDTALWMSGVQSALREISGETGCPIAYVSVVSTHGLSYYDAIMYYNAGQVYNAIASGRRLSPEGFNMYLFIAVLALSAVVVETVLLVKGRVRT